MVYTSVSEVRQKTYVLRHRSILCNTQNIWFCSGFPLNLEHFLDCQVLGFQQFIKQLHFCPLIETKAFPTIWKAKDALKCFASRNLSSACIRMLTPPKRGIIFCLQEPGRRRIRLLYPPFIFAAPSRVGIRFICANPAQNDSIFRGDHQLRRPISIRVPFVLWLFCWEFWDDTFAFKF